ncbi:hypothetical protein TraAM80_06989 [Trypanosoma rangeli]|uniref:Uncharacterized protein n=1 Tax=Trypanosoma rangeli TaxID=5698 RepID=A0A3R7KU56_TRYRA|nr:uncharacterized protein TraAM80_06989 [Trypanosoma rangeli]RNF01425.1 hypothetical protein TraAM80_06989 [Trypanosoma rangeli]|eukprot:RNF01425.1 hypothetical protein TraAM80_06989 [Trypanosoma rangeli]
MYGDRTFSSKNASPLVEFIKILRNQRKNEEKRVFPRRYNGRLVEVSVPIIKTDFFPLEWEITEAVNTLIDEPKPNNLVRPKRRRSLSMNDFKQVKFMRSPFACELLTKSSKGMYSSTYVDIELTTLGLEPLVRDIPVSRKEAKSLIGLSCCYLRLGTALVVSGCIVEVNSTDSTAQIVPEKGLCLDVEWVSLKKLYRIPEDITEVRKIVSERVYAVLQRESEDSAITGLNESPTMEQWEELPRSESQSDVVIEEREDRCGAVQSE